MRPEEKVIAILSSRCSSKKVVALVQAVYHMSVDTAYEMSRTANKATARRKRYEHLHSMATRYFYGANPCIFARGVINLSVRKDQARGCEVVQWIEPAVSANAASGSGVKQHWPAKQCELTRPLLPLAGTRNDG